MCGGDAALCQITLTTCLVFIRLEAMLQPDIGNTLIVFARSGITPPKVEHSGYIVGGWPWQILGAIRAVARAGEPGEILFFLVR